jgi:hypothetical protein
VHGGGRRLVWPDDVRVAPDLAVTVADTVAADRRAGSRATRVLNRRAWLALAGGLLVACVVHALTLVTSPPIWHDEVQIVETGRLFLGHPHDTWSIDWWPARGQPILLWSYIGSVVQEMAFTLTGQSPVGPRLVGILGAVAASLALALWLDRRGTARWVTVALSIAVFLDPIFVAFYRGARTDSLVLTCCLVACFLVCPSPGDAAVPRGRLAAAGALCAVAFFVYPTAPLLYPLVLVELVRSPSGRALTGDILWQRLWPFLVGGAIAAAVCAVPLLTLSSTLLSQYAALAAHNAPPPGSLTEIEVMLRAMERSPWLPLAALAALVHRENRLLGVVTLLVAAYMAITPTQYLHVLYLLPFYCGLLATACTAWLRNRRLRPLALGMLIVVIGWAMAVSLVVRPAVALATQSGRNPAALESIGRRDIGAGAKTVYVEGAIEFYDTGRTLGWHMYASWFAVSSADEREMLSRSHYAIFSTDRLGPGDTQLLHALGFTLRHHESVKRSVPGWTAHLSAFSGTLFGPYVIYAR